MIRLRFYLVALLIFVGIALNLERIDFGAQEDVINLASFVYVLTGAAVVSTVLVPSRWKISTRSILIFWAFVYLVFKIALFNDRPLVGGSFTYLSIVELLILIELVLLTRKVMENLQGLEDTVANITLADISGRVKTLDEALGDINKEFVRSRRYKRPLGLIVIKLKPDNVQANIDTLSKDILKTMMSRYSMSNLIRELDKEIRRPDLIVEQHKENRIILLLPETDKKAAQTVSKNIHRIAETAIGSGVDIGAATFPDDALTFEDLVSQAESVVGKELANFISDEQDPALLVTEDEAENGSIGIKTL